MPKQKEYCCGYDCEFYDFSMSDSLFLGLCKYEEGRKPRLVVEAGEKCRFKESELETTCEQSQPLCKEKEFGVLPGTNASDMPYWKSKTHNPKHQKTKTSS